MDKLYKLAREVGASFTCFGASFGLRSNDAALLQSVVSGLPPGTQQTNNSRVETVYSFLSPPPSANRRVRRFYLLYENAGLIKKGYQSADLFDTFENAINLFVSQHAKAYVFVHAAAVAWNGLAIVIPGASHSGKSTLVTAFLRAGADYLSDEFAIFDCAGRVHPFPRPICLRTGQDSKTKVAAEQLGASTLHTSVPLGMVIATGYRNTARWKPRAMSRGQAILSLFANSMSSQNNPKSNFEILRMAARDCISFGGPRGQADEVVNSTLRRFVNYFSN